MPTVSEITGLSATDVQMALVVQRVPDLLESLRAMFQPLIQVMADALRGIADFLEALFSRTGSYPGREPVYIHRGLGRA